MSVVQHLLRNTIPQLSLLRGPAKRGLQHWEGSSSWVGGFGFGILFGSWVDLYLGFLFGMFCV